MKLRNAASIVASLAAVAWTTEALAHHAMGGALPSTLMQGLISGFAHPVIGIDHLAFVIAMGVAAAFTPRRLLTPLAFVVATVIGCLLLIAGIGLPIAEVVVTGSAVLVGAMVLSGRSYSAAAYMVIFAIAGVFHGWAYGESIVGAEPTPLIAYLVGFAATQYVFAIGVGWIVRSVWQAGTPEAIKPRLAGAVAAGVGLAFLIENLEGMLFGA